jgi:hypothetical protein
MMHNHRITKSHKKLFVFVIDEKNWQDPMKERSFLLLEGCLSFLRALASI